MIIIIYRLGISNIYNIFTRNSILYFLDQNQHQTFIIVISDLSLNRKLL